MPQEKLTKRMIDAICPAPGRYTVWDTDVLGFGLRVTVNRELSYVIKYRIGGQQRWYTIGRHGSPWTPEMARKEALRLLGDVAKGLDPSEKRNSQRKALLFRDLCDLYLAEGTAHKKPATIKSDIGRINHHLKPLLGSKPVTAITRADIERLLIDIAKGRTAAAVPKKGQRPPGSIARGGSGVGAQCVALVGTIFSFAVRRGLRSDNPAHGIKKPPVRKMNRFLSEAEITRLAIAIDGEQKTSGTPYPAAALRLLLLTGCRRSEILDLRWENVDFDHQCLRLPDSKTGAKIVYLNAPALTLISKLARVESNPYVIAGTREASPSKAIDKVWDRVRKNSNLSNVRLHDLRHSFASIGAIGGFSLPMIGALLGHKHSMTTARYAHLSADPIRAANEAVGARIAAAMGEDSIDLLFHDIREML